MIEGKLCFVCNKPAGVEKTYLSLGLCDECLPYFTDDMSERIDRSTSWIAHDRAEIALARLKKSEDRARWLQDQIIQAAATLAQAIAPKEDQ